MNVCFFMPGFITLSKNILTMKQSENGQQEVIKDSKGHIAGTTRTTKDRKYYYDSNGSSAGTETKWEPASRQRKSHHTASPESNDRK